MSGFTVHPAPPRNRLHHTPSFCWFQPSRKKRCFFFPSWMDRISYGLPAAAFFFSAPVFPPNLPAEERRIRAPSFFRRGGGLPWVLIWAELRRRQNARRSKNEGMGEVSLHWAFLWTECGRFGRCIFDLAILNVFDGTFRFWGVRFETYHQSARARFCTFRAQSKTLIACFLIRRAEAHDQIACDAVQNVRRSKKKG